MIIHCLQHVPFEGLGNIENWAKEGAHEIRVTRLFADDSLPDLNQTDFLIILGGPMNVYEDAKFPFLTAEKRLVEQAIRRDKRVLGICLGSQLIADVLGAKVFRNSQEEIGWFPVESAAEADSSPFAEILPQTFVTFHWHGDTFSLPAGAAHLLSSAGCRNQAFAFGDKVLGIQFHPEVTAEAVRLMMENEGDEIRAGKYVQTAEQILSADKPFAENAVILGAMLDKLAQAGKKRSSISFLK